MSKLEKMVLDDITPTSSVHDVRGVTPWPEMSDTLRVSYLMTLPFFHTVACLTNLLIFCIFSTRNVKKYRASVFFRYLALVDACQSCVMFGLMWLALAAPEQPSLPTVTHMHCRMYTVLRYTLQDLSAYSVVCVLMERCSSMSSRGSGRPACLLLTICRLQWLVRHLASKMFLLAMTVVTVVMNTVMVLSTRHDLDQPYLANCFNTWKSPNDFSFTSLAMNHALLSMVFPSLCCVVGYLCLRLLLARHHSANSVRHSPASGLPLTTHPRHTWRSATHPHPPTHTRWIHLGFHTPATPGLVAPACGNAAFPPPPPPPPRPLLTMMSVDDLQRSEEDSPRGSCFLDRLYAMIKSREFVLSVVCVEDSRLTSLPPADLAMEMNAMAGITAVFFLLLVQPQLLLMVVGCILRGRVQSSLDWRLVKNVGLAADLLFNNRISFTLFLFLFAGGRRLSALLMDVFRRLLACCCCCCCCCHPSSSPSNRARIRPPLPHPLPASYIFSPRPAVPARPEVSVLGQPSASRPLAGGNGGGSRGSQQGEGRKEVMPKVSIMTPS